jgi:site-specific DNA recombinase
MVIRESEAIVIRAATKSVLSGRSLSEIARQLNQKGVTTSTGGTWVHSTLGDVLLRPRNAGLVAHGLPCRGASFEIIGSGLWPAVVPERQWRALIRLFTERASQVRPRDDTRQLGSRIFLLTNT